MSIEPTRTRPPPPRGGRARRLRAWILFLLSPGVFTARGQDALFNALSVQGAIKNQSSPVVLPPEQPHLGPVRFNLGAYTSLTYDDNINGVQTGAEADVISQSGINLGLAWPATEYSDLQVNTGIGYLHYFKYTGNNGLVVNPDSILDYAVSWKDASVSVYDQSTYTRQVTTEAALANIATLPQFGNTAGVLGQWDPGHWAFQMSYGHTINLSDNAHDYLNNTMENFYGSAGWRFAEKTQAGVEASGSLTSYQVSSQSNDSSYSVGAYVEWQVKSWLQLTARGGPTIYEFYPQSGGQANSTLNSYYVSLSISDQITDYLSQSLALNRSISLGANQGSDYVEQLTADYSLSWALTGRINLGASLGYANGQQPLTVSYFDFFGIFIPIEATEDYQLYNGGLSASWRFTDHLGASLSYARSQRDSNLADRSYSSDSVSVQINYNF